MMRVKSNLLHPTLDMNLFFFVIGSCALSKHSNNLNTYLSDMWLDVNLMIIYIICLKEIG